MAGLPSQTPRTKAIFKLVSLREERLERKLALAFGFMSFIPLLLIFWAMIYRVDLDILICLIIVSALVGMFIARRMVRAVLAITERVKALSSGAAKGVKIETFELIDEEGELGELARSFNHITRELEHKIEELESSRQVAKKLLTRIGTTINSYQGIDNLMSLIMENTATALEADMSSLMLVDGEKQDLYVKTTWSNNGHVADPALRVKFGEGIIGSAAGDGRAVRTSANAAALGFRNTPADQSAVLSVPLKLRDHPIGVITVLRDDAARTFTEDDELLLESIGSQVAVALENYRLNLDVERTSLETILALALAVEAKDPYSAGHSKRVGYYAAQIGEEMGLDEEMLRTLNDAGILHDIGKIGIKDEILLKPGPLTPEEQRIMQQHPMIGEAIVKPIRSLSKVVELVRCHHERFDGKGYPAGLKGEALPLGARILSVADAYDSMVTDRPYRKRLPLEEAKAELRRSAGTQHDPVPVEAFLRVLEKKDRRLAEAKQSAPPA